jgi:transcriptional regulator with XRE-family HTH domain
VTFLEVFGRRVAKLREAAGLTQAEVAERIGMSRSSVANIEGGRQPVYLDMVPILARALRCRIVDLLPAAWAARA